MVLDKKIWRFLIVLVIRNQNFVVQIQEWFVELFFVWYFPDFTEHSLSFFLKAFSLDVKFNLMTS